MNEKQIARICHEVNKAYCETLGDTSQVSWEEAPKDIQDSAIAGVKATMKNPNLTPKEQHEIWMEHKVKEGWVNGSVKNAEAKTHPCIVKYSWLPKEQRLKDILFGTIVKSLISQKPDKEEKDSSTSDIPKTKAKHK